jgi:catechol 2,3-dioxygenase-like lactoylglutathione lyase family enzyme
MDPRIHVITLAVLDLDRALEFYRDGLGLDTRGVVATEFTGAVSRAPRHRLDPYSRTVGISSVE